MKLNQESMINLLTATKEEVSDVNMELKTLIAGNNEDGHEGNMEQRVYDLAIIANATNNFSFDNKLGQGGFGPVYKVCF